MRQNRATHVSLSSAGKQWIENPLVLSILRCLPALSLGAHGCRAAARSGRLLGDLSLFIVIDDNGAQRAGCARRIYLNQNSP